MLHELVTFTTGLFDQIPKLLGHGLADVVERVHAPVSWRCCSPRSGPSAWLVICPPFNRRLIPAPVKALLALALALPMVPQLTGQVPELDRGRAAS